MIKFYTETKFNEKNVNEMCEVVYSNCGFMSSIGILTLSALLLYYGISFSLSTPKGLIFTFVGCYMLTNVRYPLKRLKKQMLAVMDNWWPTMKIQFTEDCIISETDRERTENSYANIIKLVRAKNNDYLFVSKTSAFLIDANSLQNREKFEEFLSKKTHKHWKRANVIRFF